MRTNMLLLALLAPLLLPTVDAAEVEHQVYLHEYSGGLHILPEQINARVGDVLKLTVLNQGAAPHNLVVCGDAPSPSNDCAETWGRVGMIPANESRPLEATVAKAGTFEYWCYVPGHKGAGMRGTLVVEGEEQEKGVPASGALVAAAALALALVGRRRA